MAAKNTIKNRRIELGLTMKEVADYVGVSEGTVSRWESGDIANMKRSRINSLSEVLKISPLVLLGIEEEKTNQALTEKDKRDIARDLESIVAELEGEDNLMFDGNPMTPEAKESIIAAMKLGLEAAKLKNKERFTPKKYRK